MNSKYRTMVWGLAAALATLLIIRVYAIRELLAAFALFAAACAAIALVFFAVYMLDWLGEAIVLRVQRAGRACAAWTRNALVACDAFGHKLSLAHRFSQVAPAMSRTRHHSARGGSL
jgi:hypothetical protein